MRNDLTLEDIKKTIDRLKSDMAKKEGERDAELKVLMKEFKIGTLEAAHIALDKINVEIEEKQRERARLMSSVKAMLERFGLL